MIVAVAIVTANCRKKAPVMPPIKAEGTNTATSTSKIAISAAPTSSMVARAASMGESPSRNRRSTFSTTTMASSTTMPTQRTRPKSVSELMEYPSASMIEHVPIREIGMASNGTSVARHVCRKMMITRTTSPIASRIVSINALIETSMNSVGL